jgi:formylglycine-generating enzyme required for sulfatase activity
VRTTNVAGSADRALSIAIAAAGGTGLTLLGPNTQGYNEYRNEKDGSVLIEIPAGTFTMGQESVATPVHQVSLSRYFIGKYEVTNAQYLAFLAATSDPAGPTSHQGHHPDEGANKNHTPAGGAPVAWPPYSTTDDSPVIGVDWYGAYAYCAWAGLPLPTEAQWERAARGRDGRTYPWGESAPPEHPQSTQFGRPDRLSSNLSGLHRGREVVAFQQIPQGRWRHGAPSLGIIVQPGKLTASPGETG